MQGDRDEVIPPRICRQLFDAAQGRKEMWVIPGAGHNDILETAGAQYGKKLRAFYASLEH
jgi:pimeloyl-ACP methyl ester carboxylesterase